MTQEEKDLLFKDLCARLPYGVKCKYYDCCEGDYEEGTICGFEREEYMQIDGVCIRIEEVKPYLFPLSSMTEEQKKEYNSIIYHSVELHWQRYYDVIDVDCYEELHDFYHKNHFDYRGLIPMDLANDATGLDIY